MLLSLKNVGSFQELLWITKSWQKQVAKKPIANDIGKARRRGNLFDSE
jgi:hypothetical protein